MEISSYAAFIVKHIVNLNGVKQSEKIRTVIRIYISLHSTATGRLASVKDERPIQTALRLYGIVHVTKGSFLELLKILKLSNPA